MKTKNSLLLMLFCASFVFVSCSTKEKETDSTEIAEEKNEQKFEDSEIENDTEFAVSAADGGLLEVQLGELAQSNASSQQVKTFGKMMVAEHTKANAELKALAAQKNISLPTVLSDDSQKKYEDLAAKNGKEFDDEYTDFMVKDHKMDIDKFSKQADKGDDQELKSWASGKLSALEHHLEMAKEAEAVVDSIK